MVFAAIDIGSNAMRLLFCRVYIVDGKPHFNKEELFRMPIRLGEDVFTIGKISERNQATIEELAKQPKTQNIKKTINKVSIKNDYIQNMPTLCLDEDTISKRINQGFTIADFNNGVNFILFYFNYKYIECKYNQ